MREVKRYKMDEGNRVAIVGTPGRKYIPLVYIDIPIRLRMVPLSEAKYITDLRPQDTPPVRQAAREFLRIGKGLGITKGARKFLKAAL